jgi:hypothetical protein
MCEHCNYDVERSITRVHNRALRRVNKLLRRSVDDLKEHADDVFATLCATEQSNQAEMAFRELWERGGFQPPIGPQDYEAVVERCLAALSGYNESHTSRTTYTAYEAAD